MAGRGAGGKGRQVMESEQEQPTIYRSVLVSLADQWRQRAEGLRLAEDDEGAILAHAFEYCAHQLEGLANQ